MSLGASSSTRQGDIRDRSPDFTLARRALAFHSGYGSFVNAAVGHQCALELGTLEIGAGEDGARQPRLGEISAGEVCAGQIGAEQVRLRQVRVLEIGLAQRGI